MSVYGISSPHKPGDRLLHMTDMVSVGIQDASELQWHDIEQAAGKTFTYEQRLQIFEVWKLHEVNLKFFEQSVTIAQVEKLRDELINLSRRLHASGIGAFRDPAKREMFHQLTWYLGGDVQKRLQEASATALKAATALARAPEGNAVVRDARSQRAFAFRGTIVAMRRKRDGDQMLAETWGLNPTYDSPPFQRFLTTLLGRIIEPHEIQHAIEYIEKNNSRCRK